MAIFNSYVKLPEGTSKLSETVFLKLQHEAFWVLRPVCSSWKLQQNMNHLHIKHWSTQDIFPAQNGYQPVTDLDVAMFCTLQVRQRWQKTAVDALQQSWLVVLNVLTILKNMTSSMGRIIQYMKWKIKNVWNPTSQRVFGLFFVHTTHGCSAATFSWPFYSSFVRKTTPFWGAFQVEI